MREAYYVWNNDIITWLWVICWLSQNIANLFPWHGHCRVLINLSSRGLVSWSRWLTTIQIRKGQASKINLEVCSPSKFWITSKCFIQILWNAILCILLKIFPGKIILEKDKTPRILGDYKDIFQFLFYSASINENMHHSLNQCPFSRCSLDGPETRIVNGQSCSKKTFSQNFSSQFTSVLLHKS